MKALLPNFDTWSRAKKSLVFLALDLGLLPIALVFSLIVQAQFGGFSEALSLNLPILPFVLLTTAIALNWIGLPQIPLKSYESNAMVQSALIALFAGLQFAAGYRITGAQVPLGTQIIFLLSYFFFMVFSRGILYQVVLSVYRTIRPRKQVVIYGAGATGTQLAQALATHNEIEPIAFFDDNKSLQGMQLVGLPVLAPSQIARFVNEAKVKRVLLAMPSQSQPKQAQIVQKLQKLGLEVQALPSFAQLIGEEALVEKLKPMPAQHFLGRSSNDVCLNEAGVSYSNRSVLVSGAGGSIGSELCRQVLSCAPSKLVLFELSEFALYNIYMELSQAIEGTEIELVPILGSVTDPRQVRQVLHTHNVQVVLHAAAYKHVPLVEANPLPGLANNVFGTQTLAREAALCNVERFILISSDKAVRPANVMGASKRIAELVVQDQASRSANTIFTMVRFGNVLGSSGSVIPLFQEQVQRGGPVTLTDRRVKRYFMTIREAVELVLQAGAVAKGGEVFVLDMGEPVSLWHLARQVIESSGYQVRDEENPEGDIEIDIIGLRPGEKLEEELSLSDKMINTSHPKIFAVHEESRSEIEVASILRGIRHAVTTGNPDGAQELLSRWVEGYEEKSAERKTS